MKKGLLQTVIIPTENVLLKPYIEYFLFLRKEDQALVTYTTFPNTNLCLALYRQNQISYQRDGKTNHCVITGGKQTFASRIYGFHQRPFQVDIHQELDQICVIFRPGAMQAFTQEDFGQIAHNEQVFEQLFTMKDPYFLEQLFEECDPRRQAKKLELFLLSQLHTQRLLRLEEALYLLSSVQQLDTEISVDSLSRRLGVSDTTLFRLFKTSLGQNPQKFLKTIRFRRALADLISANDSLTSIALRNHYYDQAHFIHDIKTFSGCSPGQLRKSVSIQQQALAWIYQENTGE